VKEPAIYTTASASGNIDKSKLNETEAARRLPLSAPNSVSDSFISGIILPFINSPRRDYYSTLRRGRQDKIRRKVFTNASMYVTINSNKIKGGHYYDRSWHSGS
jgi:hypothetical protein